MFVQSADVFFISLSNSIAENIHCIGSTTM